MIITVWLRESSKWKSSSLLMKSMELQCWKTLFDLKKNILSIQEELSKLKLMNISFSYTFIAIIKLYDFSES